MAGPLLYWGRGRRKNLVKSFKILGVPLVRPAQGTVFLDDSHLEEDVTRLMAGEFDWIILTTGVGTELLYKTAVKMEAGDRFIEALQSMKIAARGYKTVNMLKSLACSH